MRTLRFDLLMRGAVAALSGLVLVSTVGLSLVHLNDLYAIDLIERIRMTLAKFANLGDLYPPLREDGFYGGSRYLPLPILIHASVKRITGSYLTSGKLLSLSTMVLLAIVTFMVLRRLRCSNIMALGLTAVPFATSVVLWASSGISGDALPAMMQIGALAAIHSGGNSERRLIPASIFCAAAILSKLSAWWAPAAICTWLLLERRHRHAGKFLLSLALALIGGVFAMQLVTDRTMLVNVLPLTFSGVAGTQSVAYAPTKLFLLVRDFAPIMFLIGGVFVLAGIDAIRSRRNPLFLLAFAFCLPVTLVVLSDEGALTNHLFDLIVLAPIMAGEWFAAASPSPRPYARSLAHPVLALTIGVGGWMTLSGDVARAWQGTESSRLRDIVPLTELLTKSDVFLSEDPYVHLSRGQRPVILDPYAFLQLAKQQPGWDAELVGRIEAHEFTKVVLGNDLAFTEWYTNFHLGPRVLEALRRNYVPFGTEDGYFVYAPVQVPAPEP